jgi:hypothetical protein
MPLSNRCGECNLPIKGHNKRADRLRPIVIVIKTKKNGNKRPAGRDRIED